MSNKFDVSKLDFNIKKSESKIIYYNNLLKNLYDKKNELLAIKTSSSLNKEELISLNSEIKDLSKQISLVIETKNKFERELVINLRKTNKEKVSPQNKKNRNNTNIKKAKVTSSSNNRYHNPEHFVPTLKISQEKIEIMDNYFGDITYDRIVKLDDVVDNKILELLSLKETYIKRLSKIKKNKKSKNPEKLNISTSDINSIIIYLNSLICKENKSNSITEKKQLIKTKDIFLDNNLSEQQIIIYNQMKQGYSFIASDDILVEDYLAAYKKYIIKVDFLDDKKLLMKQTNSLIDYILKSNFDQTDLSTSILSVLDVLKYKTYTTKHSSQNDQKEFEKVRNNIRNLFKVAANFYKGKENNLTDLEYYDIIKQFIFQIKDVCYVKSMLNKDKDLYLVNNNYQYLFQEVLNHYFNILINSNNNYDWIYYKEIVDIYIDYIRETKNIDLHYILMKKVYKVSSKIENSDCDNSRKCAILNIAKDLANLVDKELPENKDCLINSDLFENTILDDSKKEIFTIDNDETRLRENGISIVKTKNGYELGIHTLDIISILETYPELKNEMFEIPLRSQEYFLENQIGREISLDAKTSRPVTSYYFNINKDGNVDSFYTKRETALVKANYTYADFKNADGDIELLKNKSLFYQLGESLNFEVPHIYDESYSLYINKKIMIFCGSYIANVNHQNRLPYFYNLIPKNNANSNCYEARYLLNNLETEFRDDLLENIQVEKEINYYSSSTDSNIYEMYGKITNPLRFVTGSMNQLLVNYYNSKNYNLELSKIALCNDFVLKLCQSLNNSRYYRNKKMKRKINLNG